MGVASPTSATPLNPRPHFIRRPVRLPHHQEKTVQKQNFNKAYFSIARACTLTRLLARQPRDFTCYMLQAVDLQAILQCSTHTGGYPLQSRPQLRRAYYRQTKWMRFTQRSQSSPETTQALASAE